ncbi:methylated-DNA-protein-cysteine S-methyltransferase [Sporothrix schenckii 1099-18]|uniref:Methylated-DNA--protein-cysteine methyltransferase n=2 Tax=Sporothrix schenckii TaxID=29908 RepID=U7PV37_SPOS1|nr:methylated-DNA-protein-cysteine S-methyltransferase [Sporothrix schenckii 1099-18]ERS99432.1 hypothetical protein HMPREF1624_04632 [Sporothrix schenckii ATCC 58251]KJR82837.1 methylated-DNA-protein-cysteine S-methyltransferase [Sporothrix schenckii 1099-18]
MAPRTKTATASKVATTAKASSASGTPPTDISFQPSPALSHMDNQLRRIAASQRTPFEKSVWSLLCQIPAGHVTTYALMAAHLRSSPRAVGNALRRNPFAPDVPCHRCVATGGGLGGFKGVGPPKKTVSTTKVDKKTGRPVVVMGHEGITLTEKRTLLRKEGVRFDDRGRVLGTPFEAFV